MTTDTPTGIAELIKRLRFDGHTAGYKPGLDAADALEEAVRVIADLAEDYEGELKGRYANTLHYPVMTAKYEQDMAPVYAGKDWLARHATGERKPLSQAAQDARRPPPPTQFLEAEQDRPDIPAKARLATGERKGGDDE